MKKVVITGATGMVGKELVDACIERQIQVLAIVRPNSKNMSRLPKSDLLQICECELDKLNNHDFSIYGNDWDVFYHMAWNNTSNQYRNAIEYQALNIGYSLDAINLGEKMGCKKFIGAGSQAEFGITDVERISIDVHSNPVTAYGISKLAAEKLTILWAQQHNMICIWGRIFSAYGQFDLPTTMISSSIDKMLSGEKTSYTAGIQIWDYLYSTDVAQAFLLMGEKSQESKAYCVGSGIGRPLHEFITEMRDAIDPNLPLGLGDIPYNGPVLNLWADITPLKEDTGFEPKVSFAEGIRKTIEFQKGEKS